jgi:protein TonB
MAYADQQMSGNKIIAIIIVALIHVAIGYALVTGLAYNAMKKVVERVTTVDIDEPPPPEEEPPPPAPSQARGATPQNQGSWAARIQENYPARAIRDEVEGRVGVRVEIGPNGRVTSCVVTGPSGSRDLDEAACEGMQRYARYNPALDAAGNPTTGSASTTIVYQLSR